MQAPRLILVATVGVLLLGLSADASLLDIVGNTVSGALNATQGLVTGLLDGVDTIVSSITQFGDNLITNAINNLNTLTNSTRDRLQPSMSKLSSSAQTVVNNLQNSLNSQLNQTAAALSGFQSMLNSSVTNADQAFRSRLSAINQSLVSMGGNAVSCYTDVEAVANTSLVNIVNNKMRVANSTISNVTVAAQTVSNNLVAGVVKCASNIILVNSCISSLSSTLQSDMNALSAATFNVNQAGIDFASRTNVDTNATLADMQTALNNCLNRISTTA